MQPIPKPEVLEPGRVDRDDREDMTSEDHRSRWQLFATALDETCGYGEQLWDALATVRAYLAHSLPTPPGTEPERAFTAPTGPDDEDGWNEWMRVYAGVTSVLAGPHGDSGYGRVEARQEAQVRRTRSHTAARPEATATGDVSPEDLYDAPTRKANEAAVATDAHSSPNESGNRGPGAVLDADPDAAARRSEPEGSGPSKTAKAAGSVASAAAIAKPISFGVLIALAARGLRPRHGGAK